MGDETPRPETLIMAKRELSDLADGYPIDAEADERVRYFAAALERGSEIHAAYGLEKSALFEKIGDIIGISAEMLAAWTMPGSQVHQDFHIAILSRQAVLMEDNIRACTKALDEVNRHLKADDWRAELGAYVQLRRIGLDALRRFGGPGSAELIRQILSIEVTEPDQTPFETRKLILNLITEALQAAICFPENGMHGDAGEVLEDGRPVWMN